MRSLARKVVIIGAGFSGTAIAIRLLQLLPTGSMVHLLERDTHPGRGLAYATRSPSHWLNVPAGSLGLDPADEGGFFNWLRQRDPHVKAGDFVPRMWMGEYLAGQLQRAAAEGATRGVQLVCWQAEVLALTDQGPGPGAYRVRFEGGELDVDDVVLATGHQAPLGVPLPGMGWDEPGMILDPFDSEALACVPDEGDVLVLGTGLTAIDVVMALQDRGHSGQVLMLSRRGLLPQPHRELNHKPMPMPELRVNWEKNWPLHRRLRAWRDALVAETASGKYDWRDMMARLRSSTPELWQGLSARDRRQFLRHLLPWWDSHRHRIAPGLYRRMKALVTAGLVEVAAGRVQRLESHIMDGSIGVTWRPRGTSDCKSRVVRAVINCTGVVSDVRRGSSSLLASLLAQGWLVADDLGLGIQVDAHYQLLGRNGAVHPRVYYVGPMLKAQWWEATAIPELRKHAAAVAQQIAMGYSRP